MPFKTREEDLYEVKLMLSKVSLSDIINGAPLCYGHFSVFSRAPRAAPVVIVPPPPPSEEINVELLIKEVEET